MYRVPGTDAQGFGVLGSKVLGLWLEEILHNSTYLIPWELQYLGVLPWRDFLDYVTLNPKP